MRKNSAMQLSLLIIILLTVQQIFTLRAPAQTASRATDEDEEITQLARLSGEITIRASDRSTSWLTLADGRRLLTSYIGPEKAVRALEQNQARPLSLAWHGSDYSGEGDLVCGYATPSGGGIIALHRSNSDATAYVSHAAGEFASAPFVDYARVFELPEPAEFLAAGDFNADGRKDLAVASSTGEALYLMRGSRHSSLGSPARIELPGRVTAMVAGEINRADGLADLAIAVVGKSGPQVLIYEGPQGALSRKPEVLALPRPATSMAIGLLDSSHEYDLAIAAGNELLIVHGRDRKLSMDSETQAEVKGAAVTRVNFPFTLAAVAAGEFIREGNRTDLAVVSENGRVQYLRRGDESGRGEWQVMTEVSLSETTRASSSPSPFSMVKADLSALETDDLMLIGGAGNQMHIVSGGPGTRLARHAVASLQAEGRVVAAMGFRSNGVQVGGWAVLTSSHSAPTLVTPATVRLLVTADTDNGDDNAPIPGSIRDAFIKANNTPGSEEVVISFDRDMTIRTVSALPTITRANVVVNINGVVRDVKLEGSRSQFGIYITGGNSIVHGLTLSGYTTGVRLEGGGKNRVTDTMITDGRIGVEAVNSSGNSIDNNRISNQDFAGIRITGDSMENLVTLNTVGQSTAGVVIDGNASNNQIGGITQGGDSIFKAPAGNAFLQNDLGVGINGNATGNIVQGNVIADSSLQGLTVTEQGARNVIGGTAVGAGNVIVGSGSNGIAVRGAQAQGQIIQGNIIGIRPPKSDTPPPAKEGNGGDGTRIEGAPGTQFGGTIRGAGNVSSQNGGNGLSLVGVTGSTWVMGNLFGTDTTGTAINFNGTPTGNAGEGLRIDSIRIGVNDVLKIGGTDPGAGNIFGGNGDGMSIINSSNVTVQGNWFGINLLGDNLGNLGAGLGLAGNSSNNKIGGDNLPAINYFGFNMVADIFAFPGTQGNAFLFNDFSRSLGLPINLVGNANGLQAAPQIDSATSSDTETTIQGRLSSTPNQQFLVQIYYKFPSGAGGLSLGGFTLMTNPAGNAAFNARVQAPLADGASISALATNTATNNTSMFSPPTTVEGPSARPDLEIEKTGPETANCNDEITYTITVRNVGQAAAIGASIVEVLPDCLELVDPGITSSQGFTAPLNPSNPSTQITQLGRIDPGGTATVTIKARLTEDCMQIIKNTATAFAPGDMNNSNDVAMVSTRVECTKITGISMQGKHVVVTGTGFQKGDKVEINGSPVNKTKFKGDDQLLAKKGKNLLMDCDPSNRERMNSIVVRRNGEIVASSDSPTCPPGVDTSTTITSSQNPAPFGLPVTFTATVTPSNGAPAPPTGTVEFLDGDTVIGSGSLNNSGQATFTTSGLIAGAHNITASYKGDSNFNPSTSPVLTQTVNVTTNATTTMLTSNLNPSQAGQPIAFIATVTPVTSGSGTPTGVVRFMDGTTLLATRTLNANGQAAMTIASLSLGSHQITAMYEGDSNFAGSTSNLVTQIVNPPTQ